MPERTEMKHYRCIFEGLHQSWGHLGYQLRVTLLDDHSSGAAAGDHIKTSTIRMVDFEKGYAITQNSIYNWSQERA